MISSWINLLTSNGWIPREQILGDEARSKVWACTPPFKRSQRRNSFFMRYAELAKKKKQTKKQQTGDMIIMHTSIVDMTCENEAGACSKQVNQTCSNTLF